MSTHTNPMVSKIKLFFSVYFVCAASAYFCSRFSDHPDTKLFYAFLLWAVVSIVSSAVFTVYFKLRPSVSASLALAAVIATHVSWIAYDSIQDLSSHNLLPFELLSVVIPIAVVSNVSAWLALWIQKQFRN